MIPPLIPASLEGEKRSPEQQLVRDSLTSVVGNALGRLLMLISITAVARMLGRELFGEFGALQSTILALQVFTGWGAGTTATRSLSQLASSDPTRAGRVAATTLLVALVSGALLTSIALIFAPLLCQNALGAPSLVATMRIGACSILPLALSTALMGSLAGLRAFKLQAAATMIGSLASLIAVYSGTRLGGLSGAFLGVLVGNICLSLCLWIACLAAFRARGMTLSARESLHELALFRDFGLPSYLSVAIIAPSSWVCVALLTRQPSGFSEIGTLNAVNQWFNALTLIPVAINHAALPALSSSLVSGDSTSFRSVLLRAVAINVLAVVPLGCACALAAPRIMALYGPSFVSSSNVLVTTVAAAIVAGVSSVIFQALIATGRPMLALMTNLVWSAAFIGFSLAWISRGALGVSLAQFVAYALHAGLLALLALPFLRTRVGGLNA